MDLSPSREVVVVRLLKKFPAFFGTQKIIIVFGRPIHWTLPSLTLIQSAF